MFADTISESVIKKLSIRVKELKGINLGQGIPSFPTAPHVIKGAADSLDDPAIGVYPNFLGIKPLRDAITGKLNTEYKTNLDPDKNILITVGAMEATAASIFAVTETDDRIGVITPDYCNHLPQIMLARGKIVEISSDESKSWSLNLSLLESEAKKGLKLVIITNPNNPTGAVLSVKNLDFLVKLAQKYGFWILSDETYSFLSYDRPFVSMFEYIKNYDKIFVIRSFSKEYAMTGWRVGYVISNVKIMKGVARIHDALTGCAPKISQRAALAAVTGPQDIVGQYRNILKSRRDLTCRLADEMKEYWDYNIPRGSYYIFPRIHTDINSVDLSDMILNEAGVAVVPGYVFGKAGEFHLRMSFAVDDEIIIKGFAGIKNFFRTHKL